MFAALPPVPCNQSEMQLSTIHNGEEWNRNLDGSRTCRRTLTLRPAFADVINGWTQILPYWELPHITMNIRVKHDTIDLTEVSCKTQLVETLAITLFNYTLFFL